MEYNEFLEFVKGNMIHRMGDEVKIAINPVVKNNSIQLYGLSILGENENISPTIYLNSYFDEYKAGRKTESIIEEIIGIYESNKINSRISVNFFTDFENVKEKIMFKLINYDKNSELLEKIPHVKFLDLAVVFYCLLSEGVFENATILIHKSHMQMWNTDTEQLFRIATENTPRCLVSDLRNMEDVMREMLTPELKDELKEAVRQDAEDDCGISISEEKVDEFVGQLFSPSGGNPENAMYVLSNQSKINGAACMLYEDILKVLADELDRDLFILPSSIHEVIIVPANDSNPRGDLCKMVREVNETQVAEEEILSDIVYFYNRKTGVITM